MCVNGENVRFGSKGNRFEKLWYYWAGVWLWKLMPLEALSMCGLELRQRRGPQLNKAGQGRRMRSAAGHAQTAQSTHKTFADNDTMFFLFSQSRQLQITHYYRQAYISRL